MVRRSQMVANATLYAKFIEYLKEDVKFKDANLDARGKRGELRKKLFDEQARVRTGVHATILQISYRQYGHQIKDMLISCRVDDVACSSADFVFVPNVQYGS